MPYTFTTLAGVAGKSGGADGTGSVARFSQPNGVAVDLSGNVYVADVNASTIRRVTPAGAVTTIVGSPGDSLILSGTDPPTLGDGTNKEARFAFPQGVAVDASGNLYVADTSNYRIRKVTPMGTNWVVTTIAGFGGITGSTDGTNFDALFYVPDGLAVDGSGNVYVADLGNYVIRKIAPVGSNWVVSTIAGLPGNCGYADGTNSDARFCYVYNIAVDASNNVYVADENNQTIRKIAPVGTNWVVSTVAGRALFGGNADGTNSDARFQDPFGVAVDSSGNVYVADTSNSRIRKIKAAGTNNIVTTLAGGGAGSADGTSSGAQFNGPSDVAVDGSGNVYVSDTGNNTIRKGWPFGSRGKAGIPGISQVSVGTGGQVFVRFPSFEGSMNQLQITGSLSPSSWTNYGPPFAGIRGTLIYTNTGGVNDGAAQFYRIQITTP